MFKSKAQAAYLMAHPERIGGEEKLKEWARKTDFSRLPDRVGKPRKAIDDLLGKLKR